MTAWDCGVARRGLERLYTSHNARDNMYFGACSVSCRELFASVLMEMKDFKIDRQILTCVQCTCVRDYYIQSPFRERFPYKSGKSVP